jgi:hypothetical protein
MTRGRSSGGGSHPGASGHTWIEGQSTTFDRYVRSHSVPVFLRRINGCFRRCLDGVLGVCIMCIHVYRVCIGVHRYIYG